MESWILESVDLGAVDESETVDLDAVMEEKWQSYEKKMRSRGLDPKTSDREYLNWWESELGVE